LRKKYQETNNAIEGLPEELSYITDAKSRLIPGYEYVYSYVHFCILDIEVTSRVQDDTARLSLEISIYQNATSSRTWHHSALKPVVESPYLLIVRICIVSLLTS
jgi:hypothetical protein